METNSIDIRWVLTGLFVCVGSATGMFFMMQSRVSSIERKLGERLIKVETILALIGEKAAKILHSPHTPELDALLEKYYDRHYELSFQEWARLKEMCIDIENNHDEPKEGRVLAAIIATFCDHKLAIDSGKPNKHI